MKQISTRQGFTLIELLVVIAIIAILAGLLLPALNAVRKKGYETQAKTEVKAIETAVKMYLNEYSKFPEYNGQSDVTYGESSHENKDIVEILLSKSGTELLNPRRIVFLEVSESSLDEEGNMLDPWGNQYRVMIDSNFDNQLTVDGDLLEGRTVAAWAIGEEGRDPIVSW